MNTSGNCLHAVVTVSFSSFLCFCYKIVFGTQTTIRTFTYVNVTLSVALRLPHCNSHPWLKYQSMSGNINQSILCMCCLYAMWYLSHVPNIRQRAVPLLLLLVLYRVKPCTRHQSKSTVIIKEKRKKNEKQKKKSLWVAHLWGSLQPQYVKNKQEIFTHIISCILLTFRIYLLIYFKSNSHQCLASGDLKGWGSVN